MVRHADTHACRVTVGCRADELSIEVVDAGRGRGTTTGTGFDQSLVRAALRMVITDAADIEVVGEAGSGGEAVEIAERQPRTWS